MLIFEEADARYMYLALVLRGGLSDNRSVINKTVLGCIVFCLQRTEKSFLCSQNLDSRCGEFSKVHQTSSMCNKSSSDKLSYHNCGIWCDSLHTVLQIIIQLFTVLGNRNNLLTQVLYVIDILIAYLNSC